MENQMTERICFELSNKSPNYLPEELIELIDNEPASVAEPGRNNESANLRRRDDKKDHLLNHDAIKTFLKNFSFQQQAEILLVTGRKKKTRL
ncbi:MAG TPA: hypothetical protein VFF57_10630, partial [Hanamia sp.]|nr:hypothetical protein [Hanamia sp.]